MPTDVAQSRPPSQEMADIQAQYAKKKRDLITKNDEDLRELETKLKKEKTDGVQAGEAAVSHIREKNSKELEALEAAHRSTLASTQSADANAVTEEKKTGDELVRRTTDKYHQEYMRQRDQGEARVKEAQQSSTQKLQTIEQSGADKQNQIRTQYKKQIDETTNLGETRNADAKKHADGELHSIQIDHDAKLTTEQKQFNVEMDQLSHLHSATLEDQKVAETKVAHDQKAQFDETFHKLAQANDVSFALQRQRASLALEKLKEDVAVKGESTLATSEDAFYKIEPSRARLEETSDAYIVRVNVPEHEKDHVKVRVEANKASVIGTREYKEDVKTDQSRLSSSSYQTYRQEFALGKPVRAEGVTREDLPNMIEVRIPKIHSFEIG